MMFDGKHALPEGMETQIFEEGHINTSVVHSLWCSESHKRMEVKGTGNGKARGYSDLFLLFCILYTVGTVGIVDIVVYFGPLRALRHKASAGSRHVRVCCMVISSDKFLITTPGVHRPQHARFWDCRDRGFALGGGEGRCVGTAGPESEQEAWGWSIFVFLEWCEEFS